MIHTESAEVYEAHRLPVILEDVNISRVYANIAYDTADNKEHIKSIGVKNGILKKAVR